MLLLQFGVVNIRDEGATTESVIAEMTEQERQKILEMKRDPELYKKMTDSIAPTVFGACAQPKFTRQHMEKKKKKKRKSEGWGEREGQR